MSELKNRDEPQGPASGGGMHEITRELRCGERAYEAAKGKAVAVAPGAEVGVPEKTEGEPGDKCKREPEVPWVLYDSARASDDSKSQRKRGRGDVERDGVDDITRVGGGEKSGDRDQHHAAGVELRIRRWQECTHELYGCEADERSENSTRGTGAVAVLGCVEGDRYCGGSETENLHVKGSGDGEPRESRRDTGWVVDDTPRF